MFALKASFFKSIDLQTLGFLQGTSGVTDPTNKWWQVKGYVFSIWKSSYKIPEPHLGCYNMLSFIISPFTVKLARWVGLTLAVVIM
jgi:hypothetical protein